MSGENKGSRLHRKWAARKRWNATVNERSALDGIRFLQELCNAYQQELTAAKDKLSEDKKQAKGRHQDCLAAISRREKSAKDALEKAHAAAMAEIDAVEKSSHTAYQQDLEAYLQNSETKGKLRKTMERLFASQTDEMERDAREALQYTQMMRKQLSDALGAQREQQRLLHQAKLREMRDAFAAERTEKAARYGEELEQLQGDYQIAVTELDQQYRELLRDVMGDEAVSDYINDVCAAVPEFEGFACAESLPDYLYFGNVTTEIANKKNLHSPVHRLLTDEAGRALQITPEGGIIARLPDRKSVV